MWKITKNRVNKMNRTERKLQKKRINDLYEFPDEWVENNSKELRYPHMKTVNDGKEIKIISVDIANK
jgi:hypothetical protein